MAPMQAYYLIKYNNNHKIITITSSISVSYLGLVFYFIAIYYHKITECFINVCEKYTRNNEFLLKICKKLNFYTYIHLHFRVHGLNVYLVLL